MLGVKLKSRDTHLEHESQTGLARGCSKLEVQAYSVKAQERHDSTV